MSAHLDVFVEFEARCLCFASSVDMTELSKRKSNVVAYVRVASSVDARGSSRRRSVFLKQH